MPPAAATECERTGWTLLMMATEAPASAAARAARWPARPAPMMRTSCAGMALFEGSCYGPRGPRGIGLYNSRLGDDPSPRGARGALERAEMGPNAPPRRPRGAAARGG